ncbi:MAG TPA: hypothetical protein VID27_22885 [Blastocatellia bacterium]
MAVIPAGDRLIKDMPGRTPLGPDRFNSKEAIDQPRARTIRLAAASSISSSRAKHSRM